MEKHRSLIGGLTKLYNLLCMMQYISPSHVISPPHNDSAIAVTLFNKLGFETEVIELMKHLPLLRSDVVWGWQEEGVELAPRSKAVTYFTSDHELIEDLRWGDFAKWDEPNKTRQLPPYMLRLIKGNLWHGNGVDYLYDVRDRMSASVPTKLCLGTANGLSQKQSPNGPTMVASTGTSSPLNLLPTCWKDYTRGFTCWNGFHTITSKSDGMAPSQKPAPSSKIYASQGISSQKTIPRLLLRIGEENMGTGPRFFCELA